MTKKKKNFKIEAGSVTCPLKAMPASFVIVLKMILRASRPAFTTIQKIVLTIIELIIFACEPHGGRGNNPKKNIVAAGGFEPPTHGLVPAALPTELYGIPYIVILLRSPPPY